MEEAPNSSADTGLLLEYLNRESDEEESVFEQQENYYFVEDEETSDIQDETADYVFTDSAPKSKQFKAKKKNLQPVETKLENETSQRGYYKVCKEIESKIPAYYNDKVIKPFSFLLDNQKVVEKEYGTREDEPNGEWIIDVENADEETLAKEINRLRIKLENVHKENKSLEKKKQNIQGRLDNAKNENERLQSELDQ
ncbi:hypothetical protein M9Y10_029273 [Tritrichomonas musculus]|uniref:Uncharacterized protein n=1 Tax=Tritrichomonas musculus TaxID=1915356 RepID=A0ABR2KMJ5_9EUKA